MLLFLLGDPLIHCSLLPEFFWEAWVGQEELVCRSDGAMLQLFLGLFFGWVGVPKELAILGCAGPCASSWLPSVRCG